MSTMRDGRGSNMEGAKEEDDWIEAQIQRELDALSPQDDSALSGEIQDQDDVVDGTGDEEEPPPNGTIPESVSQFVEKVKSRAKDAQLALEECNDLLDSSHKVTDEDDVENFAYQSKELNKLAFQLGEDPEELRDRVLHELEEADRKDLEDYQGQGSEGQVNGLDLVPVLDEESGAVMVYTDIHKFEQELMEKVQILEGVLHEREEIETREREEANLTMAILDQNAEQLRQQKQQENDEEQRQTAQKRMVTNARIEEEIANETRQTEEELQQYQHQIDELSRQTALERGAFEQEHHQEVKRQTTKKHTAATTIQAAFRSYRVRKPYRKKMKMIQEGLKEKRENERQMEIVVGRKRKEEQKRKDKLEKMKKEEGERKKREEEEKRKEEERLEIERLERIKLKKEKKEKERLEKERLKREEEEAKKEEELKKQSEEILKRILPDRQKDEQKAIAGGPEAGDASLQDAPAPDAKNPEGTPSASTRQQDSLSSDRTNREKSANEEQTVSAGESVFITEKGVSFIEEPSPSSKGSHLLMGDEFKGRQRSIVLDSTFHDGGIGKTSQGQNETSRGNLDEEGEMHPKTDQTSSTSKDRFGGGSSNVGNTGGSETRGLDTLGGLELKVSGKEIQSTVKAEEDQSNTIPRRSKVTEDVASATLPATSTHQKVTLPKDAEVDISKVANSYLEDERQGYSNNNSNSGNVTQKEQLKNEEGLETPSIETQMEEGSSEEMPNLMEHRPLVAELEQRRLQWIQDCISLTKLASRAKLASTSTKPRRQLRRPASAKKIQALTEDQIKDVSPSGMALDQVTTVQLKDLPGSSLTSLMKCQRLRTLTLNNCGVTALESLDESPDILWIDVSHNKIESVLCRDRRVLSGVDASWNVLTSLQGLEGCSQLRKLNLSQNKITRISGVESLLSLTHLDLGHNQLVNVSGLTSLVHLQDLNLTSNHLSSVRGLDQCPLLQKLDLSSNSLSQTPNLSNNVLLRSLSLAGNSLSTLGDFTSMWLPLLQHLDLSQNGLSELAPLKSFLLLSHLSICNNFISDVECIVAGLEGCTRLKRLDVQGNAFTEEPNYRDAITKVLPVLQELDSDLLTSGVKGHDPSVTWSSFEVMCRSQVAVQDALLKRQEAELSSLTNQGDLKFGVERAEMLSRHLEETFQQAVDHRYAHEYGETTPATSVNTDPGTAAQTTPLEAKALNQKGVPPGLVSSSGVGVSLAKGGNGTAPTTEAVANKRRATSQVTEFNGSTRTLPTDAGSVGVNVKESNLQGTRSKQEPYGKGSSKGQGSNDRGSRVDAKTISKALQKELKADGISLSDRAATVIQAQWRGYSVRQSIDDRTKQWLAALKIQAYWRGHKVRRRIGEVKRSLRNDTGGHVDEDEMEYAEIDLDSFDFDEDMLDKGLTTPSDTPTLLSKYPPLPPTSNSTHARPNPRPTLPSPPSLHKPYPPSTTKPSSPEKPQTRPLRQAWRGADSPLNNLPGGGVSPPEGMGGGLVMRKPPLPPTTPSSMSGTEVLSMGTPRTQRTARQEQLTEEWGFKDSVTADLMMKRAKKLAKGKKKKLDPIQRYQQIRKNQDASTARPVQNAGKKGVQRKDYFQARDEEVERRAKSQVDENSHTQHRTFDWVHGQVNNDLQASDSRINPHGIRSRQSSSEPNLPAISPDVIGQGSRVNLVMSPNAMEVQSVGSVSIGDFTSRERSHSFSSPNGERVQFPPIKTSSAPSGHTKQRMAAQGGDRRGGGGVAWGSAGSRTGRGKVIR
ncbi:leucine-rich repeat and IQ domain-containing protein 1 [Strongylocentrotus purpuratus]|uniref:Leucine-rich repeat and IQ domain-containing protein 1 n=1 Tax=Strongylocentrotus purpuratus TaxID=7668 RepID=A0A7M7T0S2_STRPU|nr:leucine-rich repeat and IQ domain-containing protein 1 [Strongylocentrotus purpuratus]